MVSTRSDGSGASPADDALRPSPDASDEAMLSRRPLDRTERALADRLIGRPARGRPATAVRCAWGLPAVLRVDPALDDGTPFPTTFWLACPLANRACGRLEAAGVMTELADRLGHDEVLATGHADAHERYVALRDRLGPEVPGNPSAGGMPDRVKCLHSLYAHYLATGANPVGAWVGEQIEPLACPGPCHRVDGGGWRE
ncbi:DUF501 domain-containing protein [Egibacter rhizosphaerae]|uniref:DUF501 domain-containing protein n=1 Tax=Egibacter rhizosphaerae TaxID=1670831 RepID=A0A411YJ19_9ACTN|nr:DUF501 domain-containing protein [Egibacter rhizosphaerae]QBI21119.1 DUF501 domain-containing protein [Egibacter rhizosphaerae]